MIRGLPTVAAAVHSLRSGLMQLTHSRSKDMMRNLSFSLYRWFFGFFFLEILFLLKLARREGASLFNFPKGFHPLLLLSTCIVSYKYNSFSFCFLFLCLAKIGQTKSKLVFLFYFFFYKFFLLTLFGKKKEKKYTTRRPSHHLYYCMYVYTEDGH